MNSKLLEPAYSSIFIDDPIYEGQPSKHLEGLACAIQDSHPSWRPPASVLIKLLLKSEKRGSEIVASGMAYGAAKSISAEFPGPAILLFGAALNTIGSAPNIELINAVTEAKRTLNNHNLTSLPEIRIILDAANQRASFDKVTQMLRDEFADGLKASGKYNESVINDVVPKIVDVTHDVRHRGLIERIRIKHIEANEGSTTTDIGWFRELDEVTFADDMLRDLIPYAQVGCAFEILKNIQDLQVKS